MSWIKAVNYKDADSRLKKIYDRIKGNNDQIDNVMSIHSLRPHTLLGHMTLYKSVLHNSNNSLPKWYLEALGVYVSYLNQCSYCVDHHFAGLKRLYKNDEECENFFKLVQEDNLKPFFDERFAAGCQYAKQLTLEHHLISEEDIQHLRKVGFSDGEILEINQVTSYFNYVNRSVVGLGVTTSGEVLGLSPSHNDDPSNWNHQ